MGSSETGVGYISFSYKMINVMMQMIEKTAFLDEKVAFLDKRTMRKSFPIRDGD